MAREMTAPLRHFWLVFSAECKRLIAYRAQFWFELLLSSAIELLVAIAVWRAVFASAANPSLGGYTFQSMTLYLIVAVFFGQATKGTGVGTFQREVYEGTLTKYLIYPLSVYSYKFGTFVPRSIFAVAQMSIALLLLYLLGHWPPDAALSPVWVVAGLISLVLACMLYFFLIICVESFSFWVDNVWALSYALQIGIVFLSGKAVPLELFPDWVRLALELSPFPFLAYFPAQVFLGRLSAGDFLSGFLMLCLWVTLTFLFSRFIMRRGLYQYTGVGQ